MVSRKRLEQVYLASIFYQEMSMLRIALHLSFHFLYQKAVTVINLMRLPLYLEEGESSRNWNVAETVLVTTQMQKTASRRIPDVCCDVNVSFCRGRIMSTIIASYVLRFEP